MAKARVIVMNTSGELFYGQQAGIVKDDAVELLDCRVIELSDLLTSSIVAKLATTGPAAVRPGDALYISPPIRQVTVCGVVSVIQCSRAAVPLLNSWQIDDEQPASPAADAEAGSDADAAADSDSVDS